MKSAVTIPAMKTSPVAKFAVLFVAALVSACGSGRSDQAGGTLVVRDAHSRETAPGVATGVVYLQIDAGAQADRLLGIDSDVAERAEIHETKMADGIMRMRPVEALDIAAGATVALERGGLHVMLLDLRRELRAGDTFDATLNFERAGPVTVTVDVRSLD